MSHQGFTGSIQSISDIREKPPISPHGVHMWLAVVNREAHDSTLRWLRMYTFDKLATLSGYAQTVSMHTLLLRSRKQMESGSNVPELRIRSISFLMRNSHLNNKIPTRIPATSWCYWQTPGCRLLFFLNCTV